MFIHFAGYYRRFIPRFAKIATPLSDLTKSTYSYGNVRAWHCLIYKPSYCALFGAAILHVWHCGDRT